MIQPRPVLATAEQAAEVRRIAKLARHDATLVRCDGTPSELTDYRAGSDLVGWQCSSTPRRHDLLISTVGQGRMRMIVSICLVESVSRTGAALWEWDTDVSIKPAVMWHETMQAARLPTRAWPSSNGADLHAVIDGLADCLERQADVSVTEGARQLRACRERSAINRTKMLERAVGTCEACRVNLRELFGVRGDRGLEVHHRVPLSKRAPGPVRTSLSELMVLCATCHRLIHADPDLSMERLKVGWGSV